MGTRLNDLAMMVALCLALSGCESGESAGTPGADSSADASNVDVGERLDVSNMEGPVLDSSTSDAANPELDANSNVTDAAPVDDLGGQSVDAAVSPDAVVDPYEGGPLGQCITDDMCPDGPNGANCSRALPGGACLGCGDDAHCPASATCMFGTCVTECNDDTDCPPGLNCTSRGRCSARSCVDGICPVSFFVCGDNDRCARASCADGAGCPEGSSCTDGWCIEDRAL